MIETICCIGCDGYGALKSCVIALKCPNITVHIVDADNTRIQQWNSESTPIEETGTDQIMKKCRGSNLFFSNNINKAIKEADLIFLSVDVPLKLSGCDAGKAPDLRHVEAAVRHIAKNAEGHTIVVEESSVPVGTAQSICQILAANSENLQSFQVLSNPHFYSRGSVIQDILDPDRILIGGEESTVGRQAIDCLVWVYSHWVPKERIITTDTWSSELSKIVSNAFLAQRLSSINAISVLCEATGADVSQVALAVGQDTRVGSKFLQASFGFGDMAFEKDLNTIIYMAESYDLPEVATYWQNVLYMNEYQKSNFTRNIFECLFTCVSDKKLAVFGFSYKHCTLNTRLSPAAQVCSQLLEEGAILNIFDPVMSPDAIEKSLISTVNFKDSISNQIKLCKTPHEATIGVHAIIILTQQNEFKQYDYKEFYDLMKKPAFIFDGRIILDHKELLNIGFHVKTIGKQLI